LPVCWGRRGCESVAGMDLRPVADMDLAMEMEEGGGERVFVILRVDGLEDGGEGFGVEEDGFDSVDFVGFVGFGSGTGAGSEGTSGTEDLCEGASSGGAGGLRAGMRAGLRAGSLAMTRLVLRSWTARETLPGSWMGLGASEGGRFCRSNRPIKLATL
jgi:hypothetical protein